MNRRLIIALAVMAFILFASPALCLAASSTMKTAAVAAVTMAAVADVLDGEDETAADGRDGVPDGATDGEETAENGGLFSGVKDFIIGLVVPRDGFFEDEFSKLDAKLREKLPFQTYIDTIGRFGTVTAILDGRIDSGVGGVDGGDVSAADVGGIVVTLGMIVSLTNPVIDTFKPVIIGLYVFLIAFYNYRQVMFLLRGTTFANLPVIGGDGGGDGGWGYYLDMAEKR